MTATPIRLLQDESRSLGAGSFKVSGGKGSESVALAAGAVATVDNKVESVSLPGGIANYTFERKGKSLLVKQGGSLVATIAAQADANGTQVAFADGAATLAVAGRDLQLGGKALGKAPLSLTVADIAPGGAGGGMPSKSGPNLDLSEENRPVRISDATASSFGSSNSTRIAGLDAFRADPRFAGITGSGQAIVILDTSFDLDHPAFGTDADRNGAADRIVYHADFTSERNGANTLRTNIDDHGTHVASISGSLASNAPGAAPGVSLILLQVLSEDGGGFDNDIEKALQWVVRNGAFYNVVAVNLSLGGDENDSRATSTGAFSDEFAALLQLGIVPVVAAGNDYDSFEAQGVSYPASDVSALGVSASNNAADQLAGFSQRHATLTDTVAPGQNIIGANSGGGIIALTGTSMATPFVTGVVALAQQLAQQTLGRRLTASEVTRLINSSGTRFVDSEVPGDDVRNSGATYSHINVKALGEAVLALAGGAPAPAPGPAPTPAPSPADDAGNSAATAAALALGTTRSGSLEVTGDIDWYALDLIAGSSYSVSLTGVSLDDPYLRIVDAAGNLVIENDDISRSDLDAQVVFTAPASGRFYAVADAYLASRSGTYTLRAEQVAAGGSAPATPVGEDARSATGGIGRSGEVDAFTTQLVAGTEYLFRLRGADSGGGTLADPLLTLRDAAGNRLAADDDSGTGLDAELVFTPVSTGEYRVEVSSYTSGTGSYTLERTSRSSGDAARDDTFTTARLADGATGSGRIDFAGDLDWYAVTLQAGRDYTFDLRSSFDNYLVLRDASGFALATDDDSGDGLNALLTYSATTSGTFYLEASAVSSRQSSGEYSVAMRSVATPVGGFPGAIPLAVGQSASGSVASTRDTLLYQFAVQGGRAYRLTVQTGSGSDPLLDPYVYLFDEFGSSLYDDDSFGDLDALLEFQVFSSGVLAAEVGGFDSGSFRIAVELIG